MKLAARASKKPHQERGTRKAAKDKHKLLQQTRVAFAFTVAERAQRERARGPICGALVKQAGCEESTSCQAAMGLVSFPKVILPSLLGSFVISYAFWDLARNRKVFGGTVPVTIQGDEWEKETGKKMDAWPREAAGPVALNPISRQNYYKT